MRLKAVVYAIVYLSLSLCCFYALGLTLSYNFEVGFIYLRIVQIVLIAAMGIFAGIGIYCLFN